MRSTHSNRTLEAILKNIFYYSRHGHTEPPTPNPVLVCPKRLVPVPNPVPAFVLAAVPKRPPGCEGWVAPKRPYKEELC